MATKKAKTAKRKTKARTSKKATVAKKSPAAKRTRGERGPDKKQRQRRTDNKSELEKLAELAAGDEQATAKLIEYAEAKKVKEVEDARWRRYRADLALINIKVRRGELIERAVVDRMQIDQVMVLKRRMLALPDQLPPQLEGLEPRQMKAIIKARLEEMIREFAGE